MQARLPTVWLPLYWSAFATYFFHFTAYCLMLTAYYLGASLLVRLRWVVGRSCVLGRALPGRHRKVQDPTLTPLLYPHMFTCPES